MTYYLVYKTTNTVNGRYYIGVHQCRDLNDGYLGSGLALIQAIEKYGKSSFTREILFSFDSHEEMYAKELEIVNEDFVADPQTYNIRVGGKGGWHYLNGLELSAEEKARISAKMSVSRTGNTNRRGKPTPPETGAKISARLKGRTITWKDKIRDVKTGQIFVCNVEQRINRMVSREEADKLLAQGWQRGQFKSKQGKNSKV